MRDPADPAAHLPRHPAGSAAHLPRHPAGSAAHLPRHPARPDPELWAALVMLGVLLAIGTLVALGAGSLDVPRALWVACYALALVGLIGAIWDGPPIRQRILLVLGVLASAGAVLAAPVGFVAILLVVVAAIAVYAVPFRVVLVIIAFNTGVLVLSSYRSGDLWSEALLGAGLYLLLMAGSALSCLSLLREQRLRLELAEAHVELQAASALLGESARTAERLRISRDLHDSVGHSLTVLNLELEAARHQEPEQAREHVVRAASVAKDLLQDVRGTVGDLRTQPADLREALCQVVQGIPGLEVRLEVDDTLQVSEPECTALVRAVQEIATNTLRHARASRLTLSVRQDQDRSTVLEASDNGRGVPQVRLGHGLRGIIERIEALGGEVCLEGRSGFSVTARMPAR